MKKLFLSTLFCCCTLAVLNAGVYNVHDFGAAADGATLATAEIQKAIDRCHADGGGVVYVPAGTYLVGTLNLLSNVELHLETGATLLASMDLSHYQRHNEQLAGIFYTERSDNVSITGNGRIDGRGMEFMEKDTPKKIGEAERLRTRQGLDFRKVESGIGDGPVEPLERYHQKIVFSECTNVTLSGFACIDAPFWTMLIVHCEKVKIHGITIDNNLLIPNSDGMDVISCSNVNISDCIINCGDDAIVLAGYGWHQGDPGFRNIEKPSQNINVSNCILQSRSSGIRIGGHDLNHMYNYNFDNIIIYDSNRGINISVSDKSSLQNMNFNNIRIETRLHTGDWWGQGEPINLTAMQLVEGKKELGVVRNLYFNNITCVGENSVVMIAEEQTQIQNVYFTNFEFILRRSAIEDTAGGNFDLRLALDPGKTLFKRDIPVFYIENAANVFFNQGNIGWDGADRKYHTYAIEAVNVDNMKLNNMTAKSSPGNPGLPAVSLRGCRNVTDNADK